MALTSGRGGGLCEKSWMGIFLTRRFQTEWAQRLLSELLLRNQQPGN
jgi:hypothetical protein